MRDEPSKRRHKWVKLRLHVYMCRQCGTGYQNIQVSVSRWERVYYKPDATVQAGGLTPPCEAGRLTARALQKYADAL